MSERDFWIAIRAALLGICSAIERKYICTAGVPSGKGVNSSRAEPYTGSRAEPYTENKPIVKRV